MKIILEAFNGKLCSKPIEVPDDTSPDFYLPMPMDILCYKADRNVFETDNVTMKKVRFKRTNRGYLLKDLGYKDDGFLEGENGFAKIYVLTDIL